VKALSLTQPFATLVAIGAKKIETRSWSTQYRGPLAIHASKGFPKWARETCSELPFHAALFRGGYALGLHSSDILPTGAVIATCKLVDCLPMESRICLPGVFDDYPNLDTPQERAFGDYSEGRWAWVIEEPEIIDPIPAKGALGLWEWTPVAGEYGAPAVIAAHPNPGTAAQQDGPNPR